MPYTEPVSLALILARTIDGSGVAFDTTSTDDEEVFTAERTMARLYLTVSAVAGTAQPKLDVVVETSRDGSFWRQIGAFIQVTAAGLQTLMVAGLDRYVRARWTMTGTNPSFTFSVLGDSLLVYATPEDFYALAYPQSSLIGASSKVTASDVIEVLEACTDDADGYLSTVTSLPLTRYGKDLTSKVCDLARLPLLGKKGTSPDGKGYDLAMEAYKAAVKWFEGVSAGRIRPAWLLDSASTVSENRISVSSRTLRDW